MRIRVLKNFGNYKEGQEFDWGDGMARVLIARGLIERAVDAPQPPEEDEIEEAAEEPQVERAVHQQRRKRR